MALDAYSFCPGGTGKKIKFCCPDFLPELQKIDRMLDGEQYIGCLQHIEHLRQQPANHDRPCLLAQETYLLRVTEQHEAAKSRAVEFLEKHPANQTALAECCIASTIEGDTKKAMSYLQRAFREAKGTVLWRLYEAAKFLTAQLMHENKLLAVRELLQFLMHAGQKDPSLVKLMMEFYKSDGVPLLLKDGGALPAPPPDVPWRQRLRGIAGFERPWRLGNVARKADRLVQRSPQFAGHLEGDRPRDGALGDNAGCIAALRKDVAVDSSLEETVESEARAMFLSDDPLRDTVEVMRVVWTVTDVDRLNEALLSEPRLRPVPFNPADLATAESPPPKAVFMLLDRPLVESAEDLAFDAIPQFIGQAPFRQANRPRGPFGTRRPASHGASRGENAIFGPGGTVARTAGRGKIDRPGVCERRSIKAAMASAAGDAARAASRMPGGLSSARALAALAEHEARLPRRQNAPRGAGRRRL